MEGSERAVVKPLNESDMSGDPIEQFRRWFENSQKTSGLPNPNAMFLSTLDEEGYPDGRVVLLKSFDESGFVFFTNSLSRKGRSLGKNPRAGLIFFWDVLDQQVRIQGDVEKVDARESDDYFRTRPRGSQIGAWASFQSEVLSDRPTLEARFADYERRFEGGDVPRPPHWGGFRVVPRRIEFMQTQPSRLHDRFVYLRTGAAWERKRLYP